MITIPVQISPTTFALHVIMGDENLERMKRYDPGEIFLHKFPHPFDQLQLDQIVLMYATAQEQQEISQLQDSIALITYLKKLARGWSFRPDKGDHDPEKYQQAFKN